MSASIKPHDHETRITALQPVRHHLCIPCVVRARRARIAALADLMHRYGLAGKDSMTRAGGCRGTPITLVRLTDRKRFHFRRVADACAFAGFKPSTVYAILQRQGNVAGGFRWVR